MVELGSTLNSLMGQIQCGSEVQLDLAWLGRDQTWVWTGLAGWDLAGVRTRIGLELEWIRAGIGLEKVSLSSCAESTIRLCEAIRPLS